MDHLGRLLSQSKSLCEATEKKIELEQVYKELTLLQNFSQLSDSTKKCVLHCTVQIVPYYESSKTKVNDMEGESLLLCVQNVSKLSLSCHFWELRVNIGDFISSWCLEEDFNPGCVQRFSTPLESGCMSLTMELSVRVELVFNWEQFVKVFTLYTLTVDILHFLSPGKRNVGESASFKSVSVFGELKNN